MVDPSRAIASSLLLGLRITPALALAPPFTLIRIPALVRVLTGLGLSAAMASTLPAPALIADAQIGTLLAAAIREFGLGMMFVLALQLLFGALYLAGRTIDVQAGFGLALLIDPSSRNQMPLVGTLFAYATGALFFALDGPIALLRLIGATLDTVPLGGWTMPHSIDRLTVFIATIFSIAIGFAGAAIATIFLIDVAIALLSRTVPQMNVLMFGFQVKTLALLLALPALFATGGVLLVRMLTVTIHAIPALI